MPQFVASSTLDRRMRWAIIQLPDISSAENLSSNSYSTVVWEIHLLNMSATSKPKSLETDTETLN